MGCQSDLVPGKRFLCCFRQHHFFVKNQFPVISEKNSIINMGFWPGGAMGDSLL
jgi:hypothetical protein